MKTWLLLSFISFYHIGFTQTTYPSPYTQHFPTGEIEIINRTIIFSEKEIVIESETPVNSIHKQTFIINGISEEEFQEYGLSKVFVTSSKDNIRMTYF